MVVEQSMVPDMATGDHSSSSCSTLTQSTCSGNIDIDTATSERKQDIKIQCDISDFLKALQGFPVTINIIEVFEQLLLARSGEPPYDRFTDWCDMELWNAITNGVNEQNQYVQQCVGTIVRLVQAYHGYYCLDKTLKQIRSARLRALVLCVFGSASVKAEQLKGLLNALESTTGSEAVCKRLGSKKRKTK